MTARREVGSGREAAAPISGCAPFITQQAVFLLWSLEVVLCYWPSTLRKDAGGDVKSEVSRRGCFKAQRRELRVECVFGNAGGGGSVQSRGRPPPRDDGRRTASKKFIQSRKRPLWLPCMQSYFAFCPCDYKSIVSVHRQSHLIVVPEAHNSSKQQSCSTKRRLRLKRPLPALSHLGACHRK